MFYKNSFLILVVLFLVFNLYACSARKDIAVKEADKIEEALSYYEEKVQENPGTPSSARYRVKLGAIYLRLGEYRKAVSEFITAIATDPSIAEAHYNLGYAYQMTGDDDLAIAEYKNAVSINPEYAEAYNNLGLLMIEKGFVKEGISNLEKSLRNNEKFAPAYYNLGAVYVSKVDDKEKAADYFAGYLECVPSGEKSYEAMQYLKSFESTTGKMPINTAELHYKRGKIALNGEDINTAILEFGKSTKENPKYFHSYRELGVIYQEHMNDKDKALSCYQEYLEKGGLKANDAAEVMGRIKDLRKEREQEGILEPPAEKSSENKILPAEVSVYPPKKEAAQAKKYISLYEEKQAVKKEAIEHYNLAVTYTKQGSIDRAIQEYKKAIAIDFTFAVAHYNLGILYRKKNNKGLAIESYKNAVKINPGFEKAYTNLGSIYKELGRYDVAAVYFRKAIEINPDNSMSRLGLAHIYDYNKNNLQLAEYHYKKYIKSRPKGKYADQVKERLNQIGESN